MPAHVEKNTKRRIELFDLYGPEVFSEALLDPIKTMHKDVLPRYLVSPCYIEIKARMEKLKVCCVHIKYVYDGRYIYIS